MDKTTRRVIAAFHLAGEPGRRKLGGFLRYIGEHQLDWQLQLVRSREDFTAKHVVSLPARNIDGIAFSLPTAKDGGAALARLDIPTVALEIYDDSMLKGRTRNLVRILGDAEGVGRMAARNLMAQGLFKSYGYVADLQGSAWGKLRGQGFIAEIRANRLPVHRYTTRGKGYDLPNLANWIARLPKPAGIFAAFDDRAAQVIEACREAHVEIPQDVAVLGVDNDETLCTHTTPTLSSVQPDHDQIGYLAAERLAAMMSGRAARHGTRITVGVKEIVGRESTCAVSGAGLLVQRALAFIRAHASDAVKPRDVAAFLKVSRSLADLRFRELQCESMGNARIAVGVKEIVNRESTCAVSGAGLLVQRALAFIRAHASEAVKPRDVAAFLKVSRSLADLRFRELQGESMGNAILHARLEEVRRRLLTTRDTLESIAAACRFSKLCRLREAFASEYGCSPDDYRAAHSATG